VVDVRVAQRAGDTNRLETSGGVVGVVEDPFDAHHSPELQQGQRRGRIVQVDLARLNGADNGRRQRVGVYLEANLQSQAGTDAATDAAREVRAFDGLVQRDRVADEALATERVVAKRRAALIHKVAGVVAHLLIPAVRGVFRLVQEPGDGQCREPGQGDGNQSATDDQQRKRDKP